MSSLDVKGREGQTQAEKDDDGDGDGDGDSLERIRDKKKE